MTAKPSDNVTRRMDMRSPLAMRRTDVRSTVVVVVTLVLGFAAVSCGSASSGVGNGPDPVGSGTASSGTARPGPIKTPPPSPSPTPIRGGAPAGTVLGSLTLHASGTSASASAAPAGVTIGVYREARLPGYVVQNHHPIAIATTNADGSFAITGVPTGTWFVVPIDVPGTPVGQWVEVTSQAGVRVDLEACEDCPPPR